MTNLLGSILISLATNSSFVIIQTTNGPVQMERLVVVQREMRFVEVLSESFRGMVLLPKVDKMTNTVPTNAVPTNMMLVPMPWSFTPDVSGMSHQERESYLGSIAQGPGGHEERK